MKKIFSKKTILFSFFILWFFGGTFSGQSQERYFDTAEATSKEIKLAVCHPTPGVIQTLMELRKQGFLPDKNFIVIGVYHERERTDYHKSRIFAKKQKLEWFKLHKVSSDLNKNNLFQNNPCSKDFEEVFKKSDGIIFFGGADIPPYIYEEKTNLLTSITTPVRHFFELSFIFHLLGGFQDENFEPLLNSNPLYPVLGICLGCQSLNVGTGGTLIQDIWSDIYGIKYLEDVIALGKDNWHKNPIPHIYPEEKLPFYTMHRIKLVENGKFCSEMGFKRNDTPYILSGHHQMVGELGKGIIITATSLDGKVVEAIQHEKYPDMLGVQFHPEPSFLWDPFEKFRLTLQDEQGTNLRSFLQNNPPSFAFHKKIWAWFSKTLEENHKIKH